MEDLHKILKNCDFTTLILNVVIPPAWWEAEMAGTRRVIYLLLGKGTLPKTLTRPTKQSK